MRGNNRISEWTKFPISALVAFYPGFTFLGAFAFNPFIEAGGLIADSALM